MRTAQLAFLVLLIFANAAFADDAFYLKNGDTVVFYGDSITDQRLYTTFAETFVVTRFPKMDVKFVHSGWGGDRVTGGGGGPIDVRLQRDVYPYKPTVMTIMLGMNDGRYRAFDQATFDTFATGYKNIIKSVKTTFPAIRITVIEPSPYDDVTRAPLFPGGYNAVLGRYSEFLVDLAKTEKLDVADLNTSVVSELTKANATDAEGAKKLLPDRVHPGPAGHLLMAKALLKAWNAPALVTAVEIDGDAGALKHADNTQVTGVRKDAALRWDQMDNALPLAIDMKDAAIALAVNSSDVEQVLDQETLTVSGLAGGRYKLRIDGEDIGSFSAQQFANGINLAMLPTPMNRQAAEVHALTLKHNNIHFARWRQLQVPLEKEHPAHLQAAMDAIDAVEKDLIEQQRAAAQPKIRHYEIVAE